MKDFVLQEGGATAIEYALIASLISILIVTAVATIGTTISTMFLGPVASGLR